MRLRRIQALRAVISIAAAHQSHVHDNPVQPSVGREHLNAICSGDGVTMNNDEVMVSSQAGTCMIPGHASAFGIAATRMSACGAIDSRATLVEFTWLIAAFGISDKT